jgi:hypothetical protein
LRVSARSTRNAVTDNVFCYFNTDTSSSSSSSSTSIIGNGSTATSERDSNYAQFLVAKIPGATSTSNAFGSIEIYIPSYTVSANKPYSAISVSENNNTAAEIKGTAGLWRNTNSISTIDLQADIGDYVSDSSFFLYGIKKD